MLESQNVKASYHPMPIHFFFINSTPICGGGAGGQCSWLLYNWWCPCNIAHGIQPRQWGATRGHWVADQERDLAAFLCPLNLTFPLHSCLKGKAILWLEDKAHCAKDSGGGQMLITLWTLPALAHFQASCWMRETEPPTLFQPLFSQLAFPCNGM